MPTKNKLKQSDQFGARYASPRPWRIEHTTRQGHALVKGADDSIVLVCHADNAKLIVEAVNSKAKEEEL